MARRPTPTPKAPKATTVLPREVAQIVFFMRGLDNSQVVRYTNMQTAVKEYDKLLEAADHGRPCVLHGASSTCALRHPEDITSAFLVSVDVNNALMAGTQKRFNEFMQG